MIRRTRERGAALLFVLFLAVALSAMAAVFVRSQRADASVTRNAALAIEARALVDAGIALAAFELGRARVDLQETGFATLRAPVGRGGVEVRIMGESGLINVNTASDVLLESLGRSVGLPASVAEDMAEAIVELRDELRPTETAPDAEQATPATADGEAAAPDAVTAVAFAYPAQVAAAPGLDQGAWHAVRPYLTTYGGGETVELALAPAIVAEAVELADAAASRTRDREEADSLLQQAFEPEAAEDAGEPVDAAGTEDAAAALGDPSGIYRLMISVVLPGGYNTLRRAVIQVGEGADGGYVLLERSGPLAGEGF